MPPDNVLTGPPGTRCQDRYRNNAAGWGWFVDPTPWEDSEFTTPGDQGEQHRMDLLTVLLHELGHLLGHEHEHDGVMQETLSAGERLTPQGIAVNASCVAHRRVRPDQEARPVRLVAVTGTLTFAPGETTKTITIEVEGDNKKEANETFYLDLFDLSSNALFTRSRGLGTILNDD